MGRLFDAYGPRPIMIVGTLMLVLGTMMTSISTEYYQYILAQGILVGLGIGTVYVSFFLAREGRGVRIVSISSEYLSCVYLSRFYPSLAAISTHFDKYKSTALGIAIAGSGVGMSRSLSSSVVYSF